MNEVLHTLLELWKWDVAVFSKPWLYYCFLFPFFLAFFFAKWAVLTAPFWLPIWIIRRK